MVQIEVGSLMTRMVNLPYGSAAEAALMSQLCYHVPGYEKDERYLAREWDGKEHLFLRARDGSGHAFPTGLLERVKTVLAATGVSFDVTSTINKWQREPELDVLGNKIIAVRPYQSRSVMAAITAGPRKGGVIQVATGGGKTRIAAKIIQLLKVRTVFLVNQKELMQQTINELTEMLGVKIGQVGGGKCDIQPVTVATIQTIAIACGEGGSSTDADVDITRLVEIRMMMYNAECVIIDECHTAPSNTARTAVFAADNAVCIVGLSASPWRDDGTDILIEAICGPVVVKISASELIELGWLVQPEITIHQMPMPDEMTKDHTNKTRFDKLYKAWVVTDVKRNAHIRKLCLQHVFQKQVVIVLVKFVEHGERLQAILPNSMFLHGTLSKKKREAILADVKSGTTRILIATSLADQGLDIPVASVVILAGGGKSSTKALQRIGRVLRTTTGKNTLDPDYEGKTKAWVHDIVDQHPTMKRHYYARNKIYKTEPKFIVRQNVVSA